MEVIFTLDQIKEAAGTFTQVLVKHPVIAFHGEMGAGKTTFIHALCEVLGVRENISSPTFSIINQYLAHERRTIFHIDLYRLKDEAEAINAGVEDCLFSGDVCLVEWPDRANGIFPDNTLHVYIAAMNEHTRRLGWDL
jgi:tRNA threonylcarbamoyladenosine biosynthesis protein TsaE